MFMFQIVSQVVLVKIVNKIKAIVVARSTRSQIISKIEYLIIKIYFKTSARSITE